MRGFPANSRWRSFPYAIHADRTPREVKPDPSPDPELAEAALKEAMIPIRPGEPDSGLAKSGKRDFWTEYARLGGCSQRGEKDGHHIVQYGNKLMTIEEFRKARGVALETAVNVGDQWLTMFANSFLGNTYKGWIFDQWTSRAGCADGGSRGEYIVLALWRLAELWEGKK